MLVFAKQIKTNYFAMFTTGKVYLNRLTALSVHVHEEYWK